MSRVGTGLGSRLRAARASPGFWALADQGIVSSGAFIVALVLARNLSASDFGVFGVLMGILVTAITINTSLIGIPLMVLSSKSEQRDQLPAVALGLAGLSTAMFMIALGIAVLILGRPSLLPWAALALLGVEIQETLRRSLMGRLEFRRAAVGDAVSYLGQAVAIVLLAAVGRATVTNAFAVMGLTSLAAAALQLRQVRPAFGVHAFRRDTVRPFWHLGRALVVVNGIGALTLQSFVWTLGAFHGVAAVGSFQALLTVVSPMNPLMLAANSIVTTRASHIVEPDRLRRRGLELSLARRYGLAVGVPFAAYCTVLLVAPSLALQAFFGSSSVYRFLATDLRIFVLSTIALYVYFVIAGVLNARQDTRSLLRSQLASALALPLAVPMIAAWALGGAVVVAVISGCARVAVAVRAAVRSPSA